MRRAYVDVEVIQVEVVRKEGEGRPGGEPRWERVGGRRAAGRGLVKTAKINFQIFWNIGTGVTSKIAIFC